MPVRTDLTDALLALIPEDGSRLSNAELRAELLDLADEPFRDEEFEAAKDHVVAMGAAEKARGPGGGLKAPGRGRRNVTGAAPATTPPSIAPGTTAASVLTGELRNQIDGIWNAFWSGGIANPLEVLEQLTYLLFIRRLDELEILEERRSQRAEQPMRRRIFPEGADEQDRPWS
jgi:type I restriction enzyme M protein